MFKNYISIKEIKFLAIDTSLVTNMREMFNG